MTNPITSTDPVRSQKNGRLLRAAALILSFAAAVLTTWLISDFDSLRDAWHRVRARTVTMDAGVWTQVGYEPAEDGLVSVTDDAYLVAGVNTYTADITICFARPLPQMIQIQVYHDNERGAFDTLPAQVTSVGEGQTQAVIYIGDDVGNLRLDITTQAGQHFDLGQVVCNDPALQSVTGGRLLYTLLLRGTIIWMLFGFAACAVLAGPRKVFDFIVDHRYLLAVCFVLFCVIFELHGSSLAMWARYYPGEAPYDADTLFGMSRLIRADEWATFTPLTVSQSFGDASYSWFSDIARGTSTDMFMVYGQPVKSLLMIFRPFQIGFLLLGTSRGLAFFWSARLACLLLASYAAMHMLTGKRSLGAAGAMMLSFAPAVQWWFAINGFVEMLIFGMLAVVSLDRYLKAASFKTRCLNLAVILWCAGCYALTLYPAWMIPMFYLVAAGAVGVLVKRARTVRNYGRRDVLVLIAGLAVLGACMLAVLARSGETIRLVLGSVYPGARVARGGELTWQMLFSSWGNLFFEFADTGIRPNACEAALMPDLFPLGILLCIRIMIRRRRADLMSILLMVIAAVCGIFAIAGLPSLLTKVTLLSMSWSNRAMTACSMANFLLLLRSLGLMMKPQPAVAVKEAGTAESDSAVKAAGFTGKGRVIAAAAGAIVFGLAVSWLNLVYYRGYIDNVRWVILLVFAAVCGILAFLRHPKVLCALLALTAVVTGCLVNPIQRGTDILYRSDLARTLLSYQEADPEGKWAVVQTEYPRTEYLMLFGLPSVTSVDIYPALSLWGQLDPDGTYEDVYNRYAHVSIRLDADPDAPLFELTGADTFTVNASVEDLKKLGVRRLLCPGVLPESIVCREDVRLQDYKNGYSIYEID